MLWRDDQWKNPHDKVHSCPECRLTYEIGADAMLESVIERLISGEGCEHDTEEAVCFQCVMEMAKETRLVP